MSRSAHYEAVKQRARDLRAEYGFDSPRVTRSDLRRIYMAEGIRIDRRDGFRSLRGAYFFDEEIGPTVLLARGLPEEPTIFTMGHELKHHFLDRPAGMDLVSMCGDSNVSDLPEKAAEVFAAELVYPDAEFLIHMEQAGIARGGCDAAAIVRLKHRTRTTLSYSSLGKRAMFHGFAPEGSLLGVAWKKLEASIYGEPFYKRYAQRRRSAG